MKTSRAPNKVSLPRAFSDLEFDCRPEVRFGTERNRRVQIGMSTIVCRIIEICVFKREDGVPKYLLLKRSNNDRIYPGIWQLVTGTMHQGETAVNAALRELAEESGLKPGRLWVAPHVSAFYVAADDTMQMSPLFAAEVSSSGDLRLSAEHQAFGWYPYEEAQEMLVWPGQRRGLEIVQQYILGGEKAAELTQLSL